MNTLKLLFELLGTLVVHKCMHFTGLIPGSCTLLVSLVSSSVPFAMTNQNYVSATIAMFWGERIKFCRFAGATAEVFRCDCILSWSSHCSISRQV